MWLDTRQIVQTSQCILVLDVMFPGDYFKSEHCRPLQTRPYAVSSSFYTWAALLLYASCSASIRELLFLSTHEPFCFCTPFCPVSKYELFCFYIRALLFLHTSFSVSTYELFGFYIRVFLFLHTNYSVSTYELFCFYIPTILFSIYELFCFYTRVFLLLHTNCSISTYVLFYLYIIPELFCFYMWAVLFLHTSCSASIHELFCFYTKQAVLRPYGEYENIILQKNVKILHEYHPCASDKPPHALIFSYKERYHHDAYTP